MAAFVTVRIEGGANLQAALKRLNPAQNLRIFKNAASEIAQAIATNAKEIQLLKGGGPVRATRLTNRSHRLYDSIGIDFSPLPKAIEVGSDRVIYAPIHEFGLGRMPKRPFMAPALEAIRPAIPGLVVFHWKKEVSRVSR